MILNDNSQLKFALPNKGRLQQPAVELLRRSGYEFRIRDRALYATCATAPITFVFARADDIPVLVASGVIDVGITGQDLVSERAAKVAEVLPLGFGRCRLCVATPKGSEFKNLKSLDNKTLATSFPHNTKSFFASQGVNVNCVEMHGSVEIMVALHLADAIVDLVDSGDTLRQNQLQILETIGTYQATLIANPAKAADPLVLTIRRRLEGILVAEQYSVLEYNIPRNLLSDAEKITPGFNSPTVSQLENRDWVAVKVMVKKETVVDIMDRLEKLGAKAILQTSIQNCRL